MADQDEFKKTLESLDRFCASYETPPTVAAAEPTPYYCWPGYNRQGDLNRLERLLAKRGYAMARDKLEFAWANYAQVMDNRGWRETVGLTDIDHFLHFARVRGEFHCELSYKLWLKHNLPWGSIAYWGFVLLLLSGITAAIIISERLDRRKDGVVAQKCQSRGYELSSTAALRLCRDADGRLYDPTRF